MWAQIKLYLWLAPYAIIGLLIIAFLYVRNELTIIKSDYKIEQQKTLMLQATNEQQQKTITSIIELNKKKDQIILEFTDELGTINQNVNEQNDAIGKLSNSNATVKQFLDIIIPDDLKRLHNK